MPEFNLHPYPRDPLPSVQCVLAKINGEDVPAIELAHAAWHFAGFVQSFYDPHPAKGFTASSPAMSTAKVKEHLETIRAHCEKLKGGYHEGGCALSVDQIPWSLLLQAVMALVKAWLDNRNVPA